jgi:hypothetical protein
VTSAVRTCPSTIWRRAAAASNMREVPDCGIGLCDTPRQNASGRLINDRGEEGIA